MINLNSSSCIFVARTYRYLLTWKIDTFFLLILNVIQQFAIPVKGVYLVYFHENEKKEMAF